jgi:hypothetical protein
MNKGAKFECFFCGELFFKADSLAANTSENLSTMYCSQKCEQLDKEHHDMQLELAKAYNASEEYITKEQADEASRIVTIAGGYRIKVKKEKVQ